MDPLSRERMICQRSGKLPVSGGIQGEPRPIRDMEGLGHQEPVDVRALVLGQGSGDRVSLAFCDK